MNPDELLQALRVAGIEAFDELDCWLSQGGSLPTAWDFQRQEDAKRIDALEAAVEETAGLIAHLPMSDPIRRACQRVGFTATGIHDVKAEQ